MFARNMSTVFYREALAGIITVINLLQGQEKITIVFLLRNCGEQDNTHLQRVTGSSTLNIQRTNRMEV